MKKIIFILGVVVVFAFVSVFIFISNIENIRLFDVALYQHTLGGRTDYEGNIEIKTQKDQSILNNKNKTVKLTGIPLYYQNANKLFLPKSMAIINYKTGNTNKVVRYSNVAKEDFSIKIEYNDIVKSYENFFLYDGRDIYVFLEETKLIIGDTTYVLPPLSYVDCNYNNYAGVYFYGADRYEEIPLSNNIEVRAESDYGLSLDLNRDVLISGEKNQILAKQVDKLPNLN